jgi:hypothetical protein
MGNLKNKADKTISETNKIIAELDIDQIVTNGITIRCGNRKLELSVVENEKMSVEDEMKEEFRSKLRDRLQEIKVRLNTKIEEMAEFTAQIRLETERKERELQKELDKAVPMPNVTFKHAQAGLSVVKGSGKGNLIWLVQALYKPILVNEDNIDMRYAKKLITPIIIMIKTNGKYVKKVSTHKPLGLDYFSHYHQLSPDCWGNWKYKTTWKTPEDILNCARQAEAVLERIYTQSVAKSDPAGLPRIETLKKHVTKKKTKKEEFSNTNIRRMGEMSSTLGDVWES